MFWELSSPRDFQPARRVKREAFEVVFSSDKM